MLQWRANMLGFIAYFKNASIKKRFWIFLVVSYGIKQYKIKGKWYNYYYYKWNTNSHSWFIFKMGNFLQCLESGFTIPLTALYPSI